MLLRNKALRVNRSSVTLTFTELLTLSRDDLSAVLVDYPEELYTFRRAAALVALGRAVQVYKAEKESGEESWVTKLFDTLWKRSTEATEARRMAYRITEETLAVGVPVPSAEERVTRILEILEARERRQATAVPSTGPVHQRLDKMQRQLERVSGGGGAWAQAEHFRPVGQLQTLQLEEACRERLDKLRTQLGSIGRGAEVLKGNWSTSNRSGVVYSEGILGQSGRQSKCAALSCCSPIPTHGPVVPPPSDVHPSPPLASLPCRPQAGWVSPRLPWERGPVVLPDG